MKILILYLDQTVDFKQAGLNRNFFHLKFNIVFNCLIDNTHSERYIIKKEYRFFLITVLPQFERLRLIRRIDPEQTDDKHKGRIIITY